MAALARKPVSKGARLTENVCVPYHPPSVTRDTPNNVLAPTAILAHKPVRLTVWVLIRVCVPLKMTLVCLRLPTLWTVAR